MSGTGLCGAFIDSALRLVAELLVSIGLQGSTKYH